VSGVLACGSFCFGFWDSLTRSGGSLGFDVAGYEMGEEWVLMGVNLVRART